jgi:carbamoyltransferase
MSDGAVGDTGEAGIHASGTGRSRLSSEGTLICGLKLTHDGAVAVVRDGVLLFSTEAEKLENRRRYSHLDSATEILAELSRQSIDVADLTHVAVDGWATRYDGSTDVGIHDSTGQRHAVEVAPYEDEPSPVPGRVTGLAGRDLPLGPVPSSYTSFSHAAGHLFAGYCTSPFARRGEPALALVWDGGMPPFLYHFEPRGATLRRVGRVAPLSGGIYPIFASHFDPFKIDRRSTAPERSFGMAALLPVSGKAMAYAALGKSYDEAVAVMDDVTAALGLVETPMEAYAWTRQVLDRLAPLGLSDADLIASFQDHLLDLLLRGLRAVLRDQPELDGLPLCLSGGCALNIKWNAGIRASGLFPDVWVPPFPNDAGSAIGTACAEMVRVTGRSALSWSEFQGPEIRWDGCVPEGWSPSPCGVVGLAEVLHRENTPVVVLSGRAELGPRALGHRSIIAPATGAAMRDTLNRIKQREPYRPVAPICLEEHAPQWFSPGGRDPYMLFDHDVAPQGRERAPAIMHIDGSARLQTVDAGNQPAYDLLVAYHALSGVPILCNTSANLPGRGFFPDPGSAMRWGEVALVWSEDVLYRKG